MKVVLFTAEWCGPCMVMKPMVSEVSQDYPEIKFETIDCEASPDMAAQYNVRAIPALMLIASDGKEVRRVVGSQAKKVVVDMFSEGCSGYEVGSRNRP